MTKKSSDTPEPDRQLVALVEDINDKFQIILESTAPIPKMQERMDSMEIRLSHIESWEPHIKLIPVMFEQMGAQSVDIEVLKEETIKIRQDLDQLISRGDHSEAAILQLSQRLDRVERALKQT